MSTEKRKSSLTYLHKKHHKEIKNGKVVEVEESVMDGPKGISFKSFQRNDNDVTKVVGRQSDSGKFAVKVMKNKDVTSDDQDLSLPDTLTLLKKIKGLEFAVTYLSAAKKMKGGAWSYPKMSRSKSRKGKKSTKKRRSRTRSRSSKKRKSSSRKAKKSRK